MPRAVLLDPFFAKHLRQEKIDAFAEAGFDITLGTHVPENPSYAKAAEIIARARAYDKSIVFIICNQTPGQILAVLKNFPHLPIKKLSYLKNKRKWEITDFTFT